MAGQSIVATLVERLKVEDYLERHIEIDGGDHGPMTMAMVTELCGNDPLKWEACADVVNRSLKARAAMWTGVLDSAALLPAKAG